MSKILSRKLKLLEIFNGECLFCGKSETSSLVSGHLIPRSKGGKSNLYNMVLACYDCNQSKSNLSFEDFIKNHSNKDVILAKLKYANILIENKFKRIKIFSSDLFFKETKIPAPIPYHFPRAPRNKKSYLQSDFADLIKNLGYAVR